MTNPCCCNLQTGVKAIGIYQIVSSVFGILGVIGNIVNAQKVKDKTGAEFSNEETITFIAQFVGCVLGLCLGILLVIGAKNRNPRHCQIWFWVEAVLLIYCVILMIMALAIGDVVSALVWVVIILIQLYFLFCVYCFIQEVKA